MESFRERAVFLGMEWSLIIGWLVTILLIWRQSALYLLILLFDLGDAYDIVYTAVIFMLMIMAGLAVTATGFWLKQLPKSLPMMQNGALWLFTSAGIRPLSPLTQRWGMGWAWIGLFALVGYLIIVIPGGVFAP
jgi:hypothetical protein